MSKPSINKTFPLTEGELSLACLVKLWGRDDNSYKACISQSLARLIHPAVSREYLGQWTEDLHIFVSRLSPENSSYERSCALILEFIEAGMITTLFQLSQVTRQNAISASCRAISIMTRLTQCFEDKTCSEDVCKKMMACGGLETVFKIIETGSFTKKVLAISLLQGLSSHCGDDLTAKQVATAISVCCAYHLDGFEPAVNEFAKGSEISYVLRQLFYLGPGYGDVKNQLLRWVARRQKAALDTCIGVLQFRRVPISRQFSLQILQCKPDIIEKFLRIACETRPSGALRTETDVTAAQVLLHLVVLPPEVVPGLGVALITQLSDEDKAEWDAALKCNHMLLSYPNALEMVLRMRIKVLEEDLVALNQIIIKACPSRKEAAESRSIMSRNRAILLVTNLRLLINLTYLENLPASLLLTLLPLSYQACARPPTIDACEAPENLVDRYVLQCMRGDAKSETLVCSRRGDDAPLIAVVSSVSQLAPTLMFRTLFKLAKTGYGLERLQTLKSLPVHTPVIQNAPTHLVHIHQIVDPKVMGKLIRMSVDRRLSLRISRGKELLLNNISSKMARSTMAAAVFVSATELALAVARFGSHSSSVSTPVVQENLISIRKAHQEAMFCLGCSAEATRRIGQLHLAMRFTKYTEILGTILEEDATAMGWDVPLIHSIKERDPGPMEGGGGIPHCFGLIEIDHAQDVTEFI